LNIMHKEKRGERKGGELSSIACSKEGSCGRGRKRGGSLIVIRVEGEISSWRKRESCHDGRPQKKGGSVAEALTRRREAENASGGRGKKKRRGF